MKVNVSKLGVLMMTATIALTIASCRKGCTDPNALNYDSKAKKDDNSCIIEESENVVLSGEITSNMTLTADRIYELAGKVVIPSGVTLTIEPGTIIKGRAGAGTLASALIVAKGGKIEANGTAAMPIIFTSVEDNIQVGELVGTNLSEIDKGLWGGVIILGEAPISAADGDILAQIEGIPSSDLYGAFGGSNPSDNSGSFTYVSIRHGGASIGDNNEINGLTLGGVGTGTTISNIEVVANFDDGIEFFGGTVNVSNILIGFQGDDGIDIDMNYSGTVNGFMVVNGNDSDASMEIDGPEGSTNTTGLFTLKNGTARSEFGNAMGVFKSQAQGTLDNVSFGEARIRASYQNDCADPKTDALTNLIDTNPTLVFTNSTFTSVLVYTQSENNAETSTCPVQASDSSDANAAMVTGNSNGGPTTWSWSWMNAKGKL